MSASRCLGIVDWGIGGLDLYRKLRAAEASTDVVYWSDAGAPPYGTLSADELAQRLARVVWRLADAGCSEVAVACNAASTALRHPVVVAAAEPVGGRIVGVIEPALAAIVAARLTEVAVIGGRRTIESEAYAVPLAEHGCRVRGRIAQPLSALIERGVTEGEALDRCLDQILGPLHDAEHLVIACTHYVAVRSAIERRMPRLRSVIDPAAHTLRWMNERWGSAVGESRARFVTTGDPASMSRAARAALGLDITATSVALE